LRWTRVSLFAWCVWWTANPGYGLPITSNPNAMQDGHHRSMLMQMTLGKQVASAAIVTNDDPLVAAGPMFPVSGADMVATLPAERETDRSAVLYFEALQLQPMRLREARLVRSTQRIRPPLTTCNVCTTMGGPRR